MPYIKQGTKREDLNLQVLAEMLQPRTEIFTDIPEQIDFIDQLPDYDIAMYTHKKMKTNPEIALSSLQALLPVLEGIENWDTATIHDAIFALIESLGVKNGIILWPLRVAVSGKQFTPGGGIEIAELLGKEETLRRIRVGIEKLQ
jgi:glutamyl-tRNA synthetase